MFMEFTDEHKVLIGDRGAIGTIDISQHYYQDYIISGDQIVGLPSETRMEDIEIRGDRMTFTFYNPQTEKKTPYTGIRVTELMEDKQTALLNKTWVTVTENELPVADEDKKMAYFSKTGIFFIKDFGSEKLNMFSWEWRNEVQLCYTEYQRPQFVYDPTCMSFSLLLEEQVKFYVDGDNIMMEPGFE